MDINSQQKGTALARQERLKKLQEPFDEKYRNPDAALLHQFPNSVYEQRLDEVFGLNWDCERQGDGYRITARVPSGNLKIVREGESFKEACMKFGIGRYLFMQEHEQKQE